LQNSIRNKTESVSAPLDKFKPKIWISYVSNRSVSKTGGQQHVISVRLWFSNTNSKCQVTSRNRISYEAVHEFR